jgi:FkbM family methyltransferase
MIQPRLIYDIGAHQGEDTAWYLQQGYTVIAVEANPLLAATLEKKFSQAIIEGKLKVLQVAITEKDNETVPFFISRDNWRSSTIKTIAEREAAIVQTADTTTATLYSLIKKYGTPHYCKIDIEGNDAAAINSLAGGTGCPLYISCEISCYSIADIHTNNDLLFATINALQAAGYSTFQLIDQESLLPLTAEKHYSRLYSMYSRVRTTIERITGLYSSKYNNRHLIARNRKGNTDYVTAPFGEALPGVWADYETTRKYIQFQFNDFYTHTQNKQLIFWVDIHARHNSITIA